MPAHPATRDPAPITGSAPNKSAPAALAGVVLIALFSFFVVYPGHDPKPNDLPVAVVGTDAAAQRVVAGLKAPGDDFSVVRVANEHAARAAIDNRGVYGALLPGSGRVLVASAASLAASNVIVAAAEHANGGRIAVVDLKPLVRNDARNTTIVLTTIAVTVPGLLGAAVALFLAPALDVRRRIGLLALIAIAGGLVAMLIVRVAMGALPGSYPALAGVTAAGIFAFASWATALMLRVGTPGILLSFLLFLMLANPGSGAASAPQMLPDPWSWAGQLAPPGALATGLRNTAYFGAAGISKWLTVLLVFGLLGVVGIIVASRSRTEHAAPEPQAPAWSPPPSLTTQARVDD